MFAISNWEILARLVLAALLGGVIGLDRERHEWAAGLRTHMLVSVASALIIIVSAFGFTEALGPNVVLDPSRVAAQVVSGIGFLGAGTILFIERDRVVRGLTTAAGLWGVAAIGLAAGAGLYVAALLGTAISWLILAALKPLQQRFLPKRNLRPRVVLTVSQGQALTAIEAQVTALRLPIDRLVLRHAGTPEEQVVIFFQPRIRANELTVLVDRLRAVDGVTAVELRPAASGCNG
jgi:putative Mg2+ transporter-C (MgtC) family protein